MEIFLLHVSVFGYALVFGGVFFFLFLLFFLVYSFDHLFLTSYLANYD